MTDHHQHNRAVLKVLFYRVREEIASFQAVDVHENTPLPAPNKVLINPIRHIGCGVISAVANKYPLHSGGGCTLPAILPQVSRLQRRSTMDREPIFHNDHSFALRSRSCSTRL